ncbi:MAG: tyrosine-type recombinase/integrase [Rhizobiaceae bacterium]|nr:tyrosine-type recombinase/integrase [Rhizobiaceae bacterium]
MAALAKAKIDVLEASVKPYVVWDRGRVPGLGLKVLTTGKKVFILDARIDGRSRRITIGQYGPLTPDMARKLAVKLLSQITSGVDPTAAKREARAKPTVAELCDVYLEAAEAGLVATRFGRPKKASTVIIDRGMIDRHIKPLIGSIRVDKLGRADVQRMIDDIASGRTALDKRTKPRGRARVTGGKGIATRTAELLGGIWTWASKRGYVEGQNPVSGTDRFRSEPAHRRLSARDLQRIGATIRLADGEWRAYEETSEEARAKGRRAPRLPAGLLSPTAIMLFRLLATTGLRPGEATRLRWEEVDFASRTISLGDSKTGRSKRPLGAGAIEVLRQIERTSDEWIFPGARGDGPTQIKKPIVEIFRRAGIDASPKVLRSTFASVAADLGYSDGTIAELLGHARRGVTERHYIRRIDDVLIVAADRVSGEIVRHLSAGKGPQEQMPELALP